MVASCALLSETLSNFRLHGASDCMGHDGSPQNAIRRCAVSNGGCGYRCVLYKLHVVISICLRRFRCRG